MGNHILVFVSKEGNCLVSKYIYLHLVHNIDTHICVRWKMVSGSYYDSKKNKQTDCLYIQGRIKLAK